MNGPFTGYSPRFGMPILAPPAAGTSPEGHYEAIRLTMLGWNVTPGDNAGLQIRFTNPAYAVIYAMVGGLASFVPAGSPLPTAGAEPSAGTGSVVLQTWPADFPQLRQRLPVNVPPPARIIYGNASAASFRTAMTPLVALMAEPALQDLWGLTHASTETDRAALETFYLDEVMQGRAAVFAQGRQPLGQAETDNPAMTGAPTQLDLRFVDSGNADLTPVLHLRSMPTWGGVEWTAHPLAEAVRDFPVPMNIYACFEVCNLTTNAFERLPAGVTVELRDYDPTSPDDTEATATTDAQGAVHFMFPDLAALEDSDLYFMVLTGGRSHAGHTLPAEWSTKGWAATDGSPGYFEDFSGSQLGDATTPLTYRIGLDFHGRLCYEDGLTFNPEVHSAPPGITFGLHGSGDAPTLAVRRTSLVGEVHGVTFDFQGGDDIWWGANFEILDPSINLPRAIARVPSFPGDSSSAMTFSSVACASCDQTSIGAHGSPVEFTLDSNWFNVALYVLKTLRELSVFLWHITDHAWDGVTDLEFDLSALSSWAWPVGEVNIMEDDHWDRGTIIHEVSHQVMWRESGISTWSLAIDAVNLCGGLQLLHGLTDLNNPEHALIEGWAEYMEFLFDGVNGSAAPFLLTQLADGTPLFHTPGLGESVEGAFANALWQVTRDLVMPAAAPSIPSVVPEAWDGNIDATAPWVLDQQAQLRFLTMIWQPMRDLATFSPKSTTTFIDRMRIRNPNEWHRIRRRLQRWNLAMGDITLVSVTPGSGPVAGGQTVTISGTNFVEGARVTFGGVLAPETGVDVTSSTSIQAVTPPRGAGTTVVVVRPDPDSSGGNEIGGILPSGYTYV